MTETSLTVKSYVVGATSLSVIVPVAVTSVLIWSPEKVTSTVSSPSTSVSPTMVISTVAVCSPSIMVTVPANGWKSSDTVAVPSALLA